MILWSFAFWKYNLTRSCGAWLVPDRKSVGLVNRSIKRGRGASSAGKKRVVRGLPFGLGAEGYSGWMAFFGAEKGERRGSFRRGGKRWIE
jgi:hypothetical protein